MKKRKQYSGAFKAKVVLEMFKEERTVAEIASAYEVHPTMLHAWRREFLEKAPEIFEDKRQRKGKLDHEGLVKQLYQQIGQQKVELDFLAAACDKLNLKPGKGR
jgi:transposase-like protein